MSDLQDIRALVFDVFGTVVDWCGGVARECEAMLAPMGYALDWTAFAQRWRAGYQPAMEAVRTGARPFVVLDRLHREMLAPVLAEFGVRDLGEADIIELSHAWRRLDPWPDVREGLARLRRRFVIAPMSNANVALMVAMSKHGGLEWDLVLGAEIAQTYKPLAAAYLSAPRLLALAPGQVMMVAAHAPDLMSAADAGLATAYVHRPQEYGAAAPPNERPAAGRFNLQVDSFIELAERLGA
jgi:2-haloacid dehalogenase